MSVELAGAPNWADTTSAVAAVLSALVASVGLAVIVKGGLMALEQVKLAARHLDESVRTRHADLLIELGERWDALGSARRVAAEYRKPTRDPRKLLAGLKDLRDKNDPKYYELLRIPEFYEDMGVLVDEGCIPVGLISKVYGEPVTQAWRDWEPSIDYLREELGEGAFENFEKLKDRLTPEHPPPVS